MGLAAAIDWQATELAGDFGMEFVASLVVNRDGSAVVQSTYRNSLLHNIAWIRWDHASGPCGSACVCRFGMFFKTDF